MSAIFKREFSAYFSSPVGYVVVAAFMFFSGLFFYVQCLYAGTTSMYSVFQNMFSVVIFIIPLITMRLFADDKRQKTDQSLLTAPVSIASVVVAKFLSALAVFAICLLSYVIEGLVLSFMGQPDWSVIWKCTWYAPYGFGIYCNRNICFITYRECTDCRNSFFCCKFPDIPC